MANLYDTPTGDWWQAVRSIADLVTREGIGPDQEQLLRHALAEQGFSSRGIGQAMDWVEEASLSGNLMDALGMLQSSSPHLRIEHPLESMALSPELRRGIALCRYRGFVSQDMAERLLEGVRALDSRDWDKDQVEAFLAEVLAVSMPQFAGGSISRMLHGRARDLYS